MAAPCCGVCPSAIRGLQERPSIPYVDGLSFLSPDPADVGRSGLTAFICDVSSAEQSADHRRQPEVLSLLRGVRAFDDLDAAHAAGRRDPGRLPGDPWQRDQRGVRNRAHGRLLPVPGLRADRRSTLAARAIPRARPARSADHASQRQSVGRRRDREELDRPDQSRHRRRRAAERAQHHSRSVARFRSDRARRAEDQQEAGDHFPRRRPRARCRTRAARPTRSSAASVSPAASWASS